MQRRVHTPIPARGESVVRPEEETVATGREVALVTSEMIEDWNGREI